MNNNNSNFQIHLFITELKVPLVNKLVNLDAKILNIQKDVDEMKTYVMEKRVLKENENIISFKKLIEIHQLSLPFQSVADFEAFDEIIVDALFNDMVSLLINIFVEIPVYKMNNL